MQELFQIGRKMHVSTKSAQNNTVNISNIHAACFTFMTVLSGQ